MLAESNQSGVPGNLLLVGHEGAMRTRLHAILAGLDYTDDALSFAGSGAEADALLGERAYQMALIDTALPEGGGIDLIRGLHRRAPRLPIVILATPGGEPESEIVNALRAGATGYLLKERDDIEISFCIRSALRGGSPIDPFLARRILELLGMDVPAARGAAGPRVPAAGTRAEKPLLSARELEILRAVDIGSTNQEIASLLSLSKLTVESHIKNIYKKLSVKTRTQATFEARSRGLLR